MVQMIAAVAMPVVEEVVRRQIQMVGEVTGLKLAPPEVLVQELVRRLLLETALLMLP